MLFLYERSLNVYENKGNYDRMSLEMSDIYGKLTPILRKIAELEGQFTTNGAFWNGNLVIR